MKRFWRAFNFLEDILAGGLLFIGVTVIFYGVIMRYFFNDPQPWVDEISQWLIILGTLIGASVALRNNHHISVEMLYDRLPLRGRFMVTIFAHMVGLLFGIFVLRYGFELVAFVHKTGQKSTDTGIFLYIVYFILPLMGALLSMRFVVKLYETLKNGGKDWMGEQERSVKSDDHSLTV